MRRCRACFAIFGLVSAFGLAPANGPVRAEVLPFDLKIEKVLDVGAELGDIAQAPTGELWLLERATGTIRVLSGGVEQSSVTLPVRSVCEGGLLDVAFPPGPAARNRAFVSFVDDAGVLRVESLVRVGADWVRQATLLDLGPVPGCRPGGGLLVSPDGKLYVGVGDQQVPANGQDAGALAGKVLRVELDGSIPLDNPDPSSAVFARGFRNPSDLAINVETARPGGTLYAIDVGESGIAADEVNALVAGGNHGWDVVSGDSGGAFDDPLVSVQPALESRALAALGRQGLGPSRAGALVVAGSGSGELQLTTLEGVDLDAAGDSATLFDPDGDPDGTPDATCPAGLQVLTETGDGLLYAAGPGASGGLWRIYRDLPGPREVSAPGSPFPLRVGKEGSDLRLVWERLDPLDVGRPARNGGQSAEAYQIWEGSLPIAGGYDHAIVAHTDGAAFGAAMLQQAIAPAAGDRYFLVSAQGDNLLGTTGQGSTGEARDVAVVDHCEAVGLGNASGDCIDDFRHPITGQPLKLIDYNPLSPTYLQALSIRDFRGKVVHMDIAASDCFFCNLQAPTFPEVDRNFGGRDFVLLTVMNGSEFIPRAWPTPEACATGIADWVALHGEETPILCDTDLNADGFGDVSNQYFHSGIDLEPCGGFSQNFFIDQGGVLFDFGCSFTPGSEVTTIIAPEINPEFCE